MPQRIVLRMNKPAPPKNLVFGVIVFTFVRNDGTGELWTDTREQYGGVNIVQPMKPSRKDLIPQSVTF